MKFTEKSKGLSLKAGTALLATSVVGTGIPIPTVFAADESIHVADAVTDEKVTDRVYLTLEGDNNAVDFETSRTVRELLHEFAEKAMPDSVSVADNCGIYLRFDEKDTPKTYFRQIMRVGTIDGDTSNSVTARDFISDIMTYQAGSSDGWVQMAFTQREDGTGGVMSNTIFKVRVKDEVNTDINGVKRQVLEFNMIDVSPAKQVTISYNFNGGRNDANGATSYRGYRYSDEYFDCPDLDKTMAHDTKYFTGWYTTKAGADNNDANLKVDLMSRFTENTTLYAGWSSVEPPEFYDIVYTMPNGDVVHYTGKHPGKYVNKNADGSFTAEKNITFTSQQINPETELFVGYYKTSGGKQEYKADEEVPRGSGVFVRKATKTRLHFMDSTGKELGVINFALGYPLSKFHSALPSYAQGKNFRLTNGKTLHLSSTITDRDFSMTDSEWDVSCFEIEPEKAKYTVTYDACGGTLSGTTSKTVEEGSTLGSLPKPVKQPDKKVFEGWYTAPEGGEKVTSATTVTENMTIYAHWSDAKGTLTFNGNGGTVRGVSTMSLAYGSEIGSLPDAVRDEYVFQGWYTAAEGGTKITEDTTFVDDMTVYAHWNRASDPKTVRFNPNEGKVDGSVQIKDVTVENGQKLGTLPAATRDGYDFVGWFTAVSGGTKVTADTVVTEDMMLYAQWQIHAATNHVKILTLNKTSIEVDYGEELGLSYSFAPANADNAVFYWTSSNPDVIRVSGSDTFQYVGSGTTTLTVHTLDDTKSASCTVKVNPVKQLVTTLRFDYPEQTVIKGGENNVNLNYTYGPVGADNANFKFTSSDPDIIRIEEDGSSWAYGTKYGTVTITIGTLDGTKSATCKITVKEKDTTDPTPPEKVYYTLKFDTAGGNTIASERVEAGGTVTLPSASRSGYDFLGWFLDDGTKVTKVTLNGDLTVHARWESNIPVPDMATVRYDAQNGTPATSAQVEKGHAIGVLPSVSRDGYRFLGWFTQSAGGSRVNASTVVNGDMTVYAQWESTRVNQYRIRLVPNQGFINGSSETVDLGTVLTENTSDGDNLALYVPERPGYTFTGWFDNAVGGHLVYDVGCQAVDGRYWNAGKYIGGQDLQLYAQWVRNVEKYKLKYDVRGGDAIEDAEYEIGSVVTAFPTPTKPNCEFLGWFDAPTGGNPVTRLVMNEEKRIYAQWKDLSDPTPSEEEVAAAKAVDDLIQAIGEVEYTDVCKEKIAAARVAYDQLSEMAKSLVKDINTLKEAEKQYAELGKDDPKPDEDKKAAEAVDALIRQIGEVELSDACKQKIDKAREAYDALTTDQKALVTMLSVLNKAEADYSKLEQDDVEKFTLTFDSQGGSAVPAVTVAKGTKVESFATPSREGYEFTGWYTAPEGGTYVSNMTMGSNVTIYAHWQEKVVDPAKKFYHVSLLPGWAGYPANSYEVEEGSTFTAFPELERDGYEFLGWFTKSEGGEKVTSYAGPKDATFYGQWKKAEDDPSQPVDPNAKLQGLFWMLRNEDGTTQTVTEMTVTTKDVSALNSLLYGWTPKNAAESDDFVISSSDTSIVSITNGNWVKVQKAGKVDLILTYKKDKTKTAVCHLTVKPADGSEDYEDPDWPDDADAQVAYVESLIDNIPWPVEYTKVCKAAIDKARFGYDKLTSKQKQEVAEDSVKRLLKAEEDYAKLKTEADKAAADAVKELITSIGKVTADDECKKKIDEARDAYENLTEDQKKLVDNVHILDNAESEYEALVKGEVPGKPDDPNEPGTNDPNDPGTDPGDKTKVDRVYWTDRNDPDRKEVKEITIDKQDISNLTNTIYTWTPGEAAKSGDFVITSSNEDVIRMKTDTVAEILKAGETDLTVTYKKDSSKKADLHVIVTDKNGTGDKPGNTTPIDPDDPMHPNPGDSSNPNDPGNSDQPGTNPGDNSGSTTPDKTGPYLFRMIFTDGTDRNIKVQDPASSTIRNMLDTLSQLNSKLVNVTKVTVKTATMQEVTVDMNVPLTYLTELAEAGDVLVIGYDNSGTAVGCARITKTADKSYTVKFSKDTNVDLTKKDASDGSGVSDQSKVANTGKSDTAATPVKTSDSAVVPVFGGIAAGLVAVLSGLAFWKRKKLD